MKWIAGRQAAITLVVLAGVLAGASRDALAQDAAKLRDAIAALHSIVAGEGELTPEQIQAHIKTIDANKAALATDAKAITACMAFVKAHDAKLGPLFLKTKPMNNRKPAPENAIHWAAFWTMQHLIDEVYTTQGLAAHEKLIDGVKFGTAEYFPGKVEAPISAEPYTVKINASYPVTWGGPMFMMDKPARKPTGAYLVPGTIATVTVPESLVNKGYQARVGAHSWDLQKKPRVNRLYRVTTLYDINATTIKVANPLGGGIYIEVPYESDGGIVDVTITGAARSPYFSWKSFHKTTLEEWKGVERTRKAPWADFQSDKFMMQVPTCWIYKLEDPVTLMKDWDKAMDIMSDLMGRPRLFGREVLYTQVDTQLRGRAFHPGYPGGNRGYDPMKDYGGYHNNHLVRGPQHAHSYEMHEKGHGFLFPKWAGDREAAVNLPHAAVMNIGFGMDLNEAFRDSRSNPNKFRTLETEAIAWMMSDHFLKDGLMRGYERQYQLKGHAKFVDIARLFGWETIGKFFKSAHQDHMDGKPWPRNSDGEDGDQYTFRLSQAAGVDVRPLIHFWGIPIVNQPKSDAAIKQANLKPSAKIYDLLVKYKKLIPADREAFREFARQYWGKPPSPKGYTTQRNHADRWETYDKAYAKQVHEQMQAILDLYFPDGRPKSSG